jgi:hypothetical protein
MESVAKLLFGLAAVLAIVGAGLLIASKLGISRLPGDIVIDRDGFKLYAPIGVMIVVSLVLTVVLNLISRH